MTTKLNPRHLRRLALLLAVLVLSAIPAFPAGGISPGPDPRRTSHPSSSTRTSRSSSERTTAASSPAPSSAVPLTCCSTPSATPTASHWLTATYRAQGGENKLSDGWEYTIEYPALDEQPVLDPDQSYLLALLVQNPNGSDPLDLLRPDSRAPVGQAVGQGTPVPGARPAGAGPWPAGPSRESTAPCVAWWSRPPARASANCRGGVAAHGRHLHRHTSRPHLRSTR